MQALRCLSAAHTGPPDTGDDDMSAGISMATDGACYWVTQTNSEQLEAGDAWIIGDVIDAFDPDTEGASAFFMRAERAGWIRVVVRPDGNGCDVYGNTAVCEYIGKRLRDAAKAWSA